MQGVQIAFAKDMGQTADQRPLQSDLKHVYDGCRTSC